MMMIVIVVIMIVIAMRMIVMVRVILLIGGGIEPGARVGLGVGGIEPLGAQRAGCRRPGSSMREIVAAGLSRRSRAVSAASAFRNARRIDQIELGDQDMVGERDLAHGFDVIVQRAFGPFTASTVATTMPMR